MISCLALAHRRHATLWYLLLHLHNLADTRDATLWYLLLNLHNLEHTWCCVMISALGQNLRIDFHTNLAKWQLTDNMKERMENVQIKLFVVKWSKHIHEIGKREAFLIFWVHRFFQTNAGLRGAVLHRVTMFWGPVLAKFQGICNSQRLRLRCSVISPRGWGGGLVAGHGLQEIDHTWSGWDEIHTSYDDATDMVSSCCWSQSRHQNVKAELSDVFHPSFRFSQKVPKAWKSAFLHIPLNTFRQMMSLEGAHSQHLLDSPPSRPAPFEVSRDQPGHHTRYQWVGISPSWPWSSGIPKRRPDLSTQR